MSAIANIGKATMIAMTPFTAVYFWPKQQHQILHYTPQNAPAPLLSFPQATLPVNSIPQSM